MKTKTLFIKLLLTALLMIAFFSCAKSGTANLITVLMIAFFACRNSSASNKNQNNKPGESDDTGGNTKWDGVNENIIEFGFKPDAITSSASPFYSSAFVYSFEEIIYKGSPYAVVSTYKNCSVYKYGSGWQTVNTGNVVLTLLNGNRKFIVDYPGIRESFPEIIYVYQQQQAHEKISTSHQ